MEAVTVRGLVGFLAYIIAALTVDKAAVQSAMAIWRQTHSDNVVGNVIPVTVHNQTRLVDQYQSMEDVLDFRYTVHPWNQQLLITL